MGREGMSQSKVMGKGRSGSGSGGKGGGPSSQLLLIELKHRILAALNKLADRDTQQLAVEDMERIAESLSPEGLSLCLSCLYDTDVQQKSVVRRESVKMLGTLATLHGELLAPHLPKMVANIVRRLKDPDSNIRDACVETMGTLAAQIGGGERGSTINVFVKPLFEALSEQNRNLQVGAALCLARVIDCTKDPHPATLQRLCPRIVKLLGSTNFLAKASLLTTIGGLAQVAGVITGSQMTVLMISVQEALENSEWATRKAAADTLAHVATALGSALTPFKASSTAALEACRFDKVKPVRDSVAEALQMWKAVPDATGSETPAPPSLTAKGGAAMQSPDFASPIRSFDMDTSSPTPRKSDMSLLMRSAASVNASYPASTARSKSFLEKGGSTSKKRTPALSDKKTNPDFFRKLENCRNSEQRRSGDWQIEVAVPRGVSPTADLEQEGLDNEDNEAGDANDGELEHQGISIMAFTTTDSASLMNGFGVFVTPKDGTDFQEKTESGRRSSELASKSKTAGVNGVGLKKVPTPESLENAMPWLDRPQQQQDVEQHSWDASVPATSPSSSTASYDDAAVPGGGSATIRRQFHNLERQQCTIMEMLQEFMISVHDSMQGLEGRVRRVERVVDDMARSANQGADRLPNGTFPAFEGASGRSLSKFLAGADFLSSKIRKANGERPMFAERLSESVPSSARSRESSWKAVDSGLDAWNGFAYGASLRNGGNPIADASCRVNLGVASELVGRGRDDLETEQVVNRRVWDRGSGPVRQGEGPSARSVWQASKDEATLAAIRGAAPPDKTSPRPSDTSSDYKSSTGNKGGGGPFWMLWSRAIESVLTGDLDTAYVEILGSGDELLLVRMMGRTGPVLQQLSPATALQLVRTIIQLLQQQSFLDCILPWIQQVTDLITSNGADCLGLSGEVRKELVTGLQDASAMEFSEAWMASTIGQLALQLANAWSIDSGLPE